MTNNIHYLHRLRKEQGLSIKDLAIATSIDQSALSKIEGGKRQLPEKQLETVAEALRISLSILKKEWYADKIVNLLYDDIGLSKEILMVAEDRIAYLKKTRSNYPPELSDDLVVQLAEIDRLKKRWTNCKALNEGQLLKMKSYFRTSYTHDSNKIEGNTLTLKETELVVNQGITISGKSVTEHLEAVNHSEAVELIYDLIQSREDLSARMVLQLHGLILRGIDRHNAGIYRRSNVRISGSSHVPPPHYKLIELMESYYTFYENSKSKLHPVILAAEIHERLVSIHPFIDGNGRTSRLVMNLILLRYGYTLVSLKGDDKSRLAYYDALEQKQVDNDSTSFYQLIVRAVKESLLEHLEWTE